MEYFIKKVYVEKFRKLSNLEFDIGKKITVLSGHNGVGKSTLLSLIASASGTNQRRIDNQPFQPDFENYFKIDLNENYVDYRMIVGFNSISKQYDFFKRIGLRNDTQTGRGIRALPRTTKKPGSESNTKDAIRNLKSTLNIGDSSRVPVPTIYLSLSRLYPTGESKLVIEDVGKKRKIYQKNYYKKYKEWYNLILSNSISQNSEEISIMTKKLTDSSKLYMPLNDSSASTQSVGQDNLGTIISALVDFYSLSLNDDYKGGFLFIDEIEASLHPSALIRLFTLLDQLSGTLKLQIFLTTHSLTILKEIIDKQNVNSEEYQLIYMKGLRDPNVTKYIDYDTLKSDLFNETQSIQPKIKIYCEDSETVKLFNLIIGVVKQLKKEISLPMYEIIPIYLGCTQLENLPEQDSHFQNVLIILDGDAKSKEKIKIEEWQKNKNIEQGRTSKNFSGNIVTLPGFLSPEGFLYKLIYIYCHDYLEHQDFWRSLDRNPETTNYTSERVQDLFLLEDDKVNLDKLKKNSDKMFDFCEKSQIIFDYYSNVRPEEINDFVSKLSNSFNQVSKKIKSSRM